MHQRARATPTKLLHSFRNLNCALRSRRRSCLTGPARALPVWLHSHASSLRQSGRGTVRRRSRRQDWFQPGGAARVEIGARIPLCKLSRKANFKTKWQCRFVKVSVFSQERAYRTVGAAKNCKAAPQMTENAEMVSLARVMLCVAVSSPMTQIFMERERSNRNDRYRSPTAR
jgi:hypothetical protein